VAVVSWGSSPIFGTFLARRDVEELVAAFTDLAPLRVVWLLKPKNLPEGLTLPELNLPPNVQTFSWVDINDLLGHPNVRLFVTHGGYHSAVEAVFHGVVSGMGGRSRVGAAGHGKPRLHQHPDTSALCCLTLPLALRPPTPHQCLPSRWSRCRFSLSRLRTATAWRT
jgi:hypothetical protein